MSSTGRKKKEYPNIIVSNKITTTAEEKIPGLAEGFSPLIWGRSCEKELLLLLLTSEWMTGVCKAFCDSRVSLNFWRYC
jgi:hypothetical protein